MPFDAEHFAPVRLLDRDPKSLTDPRERLEYLRDFLRELPDKRFDMAHPGTYAEAGTGTCGSPACIGGWNRAIFSDPDTETGSIRGAGERALGLTGDQVQSLFFPMYEAMSNGRSPVRATPTQAANVLTHLLKTGEVDWSVA